MINKGITKKYFTLYENEQSIESFKTKSKAIETLKAIKESNKLLGIKQKYYTIKTEYIKTFFVNDN